MADEQLYRQRALQDVDAAFDEAKAILNESSITEVQLSKLSVSKSFYSFGGVSGAPDVVLKTPKPLRDDEALLYAAARLWAICKKIHACDDWSHLPPQALQQMEIWRQYTKYPADAKNAISAFQRNAGKHSRWYTEPLKQLSEKIYKNKMAAGDRVTAEDIFNLLDGVGNYPSPIADIERVEDKISIVPENENQRVRDMNLRSFSNFCSKNLKKNK